MRSERTRLHKVASSALCGHFLAYSDAYCTGEADQDLLDDSARPLRLRQRDRPSGDARHGGSAGADRGGSDKMQLFTALSGDVLGHGFRDRILTSPVAGECEAHDEFLDSDVTSSGPALSPYRGSVPQEAHQGQAAQAQAAVSTPSRPSD